MWNWLQMRWRMAPPRLGVPPTYRQLRRLCRWQARQLRRLAQGATDAVARPAREHATEMDEVLRHHPLRDDLQRTSRQSADLLQRLAPDKMPP